MNFIAKLGCRIFQIAFRVALPILPYREPKIYNSIAELRELFSALKVSSVLLITDKFLRESGATAGLEELLMKNSINCAVYDGTRANPTVANVEEARELYMSEGCECIIALGGGSSMDCAKAVGARIAYPNKPLKKMKGILRVLRRIPTLIAIPTTAGTGSEVTLAAVITDDKEHHKYAINSFPLIPRYAVLDPELTYSLPPHLTATTGMDALTHAVEAYIGRSTTKATRAMATEAVKLIFENIETAYSDGHNREARENMLRAAYLAGNAFTQSYVGYIHAIAHSLGGKYNIPHGLANSVIMPYVLEEYDAAAHKKLHRLAIAAGISTESESDRSGAEKFISAVREMNKRMKIPEKLNGIRKEDIREMSDHAAKEANPLYPVPVIWGADELAKLYLKIGD